MPLLLGRLTQPISQLGRVAELLPGSPLSAPSENRADRLKAQIMDRVLVLNQQGGEFGT